MAAIYSGSGSANLWPDPPAFWVSFHHVSMSNQEGILRDHYCHVVLILDSSWAHSHSPALSFKLVKDSFFKWRVRLVSRTLKMTVQVGRNHLSSAKASKWLGQYHPKNRQ